MQEQVPTTPKLELTYWKIRGNAQVIRNLMEYLGMPYTDNFIEMPKNIDPKQVSKILHSLPILKDEDFTIVQVVPIAKYLCRKAGRQDLLGKTPEDQAKIEQMLIRQLQFKNSMMTEVLSKEELTSKDPNKRLKLIKQAFEEPIRKNMLTDCNRMVATKGWAMGYISVLDFFLYELGFCLNGFFPQVRQNYVQLFDSFCKRFQAIESIHEYFQSDRIINNVSSYKFSLKWKGDPKYK